MASTTLLLLLLLLVVAADVHSLTNANLPHASRSPRDSSFLNGKTSLNLAESTGGSHSSNAAETSVDGSVVNSLAIDSSVDIVAEGVATVPSSIFNLAKTILGAGILSLPSGVAAFSDSKTALLPATLLLVSLGIVSAYSFSSIGKACSTHKVDSFADAWRESVDKKTGTVISAIITFKTFFACLAYSLIIGDSFSQIFRSFGMPPFLCKRNNVIVAMTSVIVFPLCLLKSLDALKYTSILGLLGTIYCGAFMAFRFFQGSYAEGGKYFGTIAETMRPSFDMRTEKAPVYLVLMLVSMISTAYVAHYNAPKFMAELQKPTMPRYNRVVSAAFAFAIMMYIGIMWIGFLTFGGNSTGFVLNNYSNDDVLATVARIAIGAGIVCGYPLTFSALRDGTMDLLGVGNNLATTGTESAEVILAKKNQERDRVYLPVSIGLLAVITGIGLMIDNVGTVVSFSGALIGSMVIYIIPSIMNICNIQKGVMKRDSKKFSLGEKVETVWNYFLTILGMFLGVAGVWVNLKGKAAH